MTEKGLAPFKICSLVGCSSGLTSETVNRFFGPTYETSSLKQSIKIFVKDPARKVTVPSQMRDSDKTTLTWPQLRDVLSRQSARDRILLEFDMTNALRPEELFAL